MWCHSGAGPLETNRATPALFGGLWAMPSGGVEGVVSGVEPGSQASKASTLNSDLFLPELSDLS